MPIVLMILGGLSWALCSLVWAKNPPSVTTDEVALLLLINGSVLIGFGYVARKLETLARARG